MNERSYTGFKGHLLQDLSAPLSAWFASRAEARWACRNACALIAAERVATTPVFPKAPAITEADIPY